MREIGKEPQLAGVKHCHETFHEETPRAIGMTSRLRPIARTLRSAVAAAINKAIFGTKGLPFPGSDACGCIMFWLLSPVTDDKYATLARSVDLRVLERIVTALGVDIDELSRRPRGDKRQKKIKLSSIPAVVVTRTS